MLPIPRLTSYLDARLTAVAGVLLVADLLLIIAYGAQRLARAMHGRAAPALGWRWDISVDHSYAELLGYAKLGLVVLALASVGKPRLRPVYPALAALFAGALLDDVLRLHERLGGRLVEALGLSGIAGLRPQDSGELLTWAGLGLVLLVVAFAGFIRSAPADRANALVLLAGLAVLALFAIVGDMANVIAQGSFSGATTLFTVLEDGGEQVALTGICVLALLVRREVLRRPAAGAPADRGLGVPTV